MKADFDLVIVGGGITGSAAARDAAGRGLSVALFEARDLGSGTTARSSRLIHGGLRYLEHFQLGLVRESLVERNRLFAKAPALVRPERFTIPFGAGNRPAPMIAAGLLLYDLLSFTRSARIGLKEASYIDGFGEPERMAAALAAEAADRGASIFTYAPVVALPGDGRVVTDGAGEFRTRSVLLALGPWTDRALAAWNLSLEMPILAPTRGTHLLLAEPLDRPYLLQASSDGRVFFALPAFGGTMIGTTDLDDDSDPAAVRPREEEIAYLLREFERSLPDREATMRGAWTGLRPLMNARGSANARSRGEILMRHPHRPEIVLIAGGKLTTMRSMAERAVDLVERGPLDRAARPWTASARLTPAPDNFHVQRLSDLLLRRTMLGYESTGDDLCRMARRAAEPLGWDESRFTAEYAAFLAEARDELGLTLA
jgi:glycerol-3-phosphate dehydrogenase